MSDKEGILALRRKGASIRVICGEFHRSYDVIRAFLDKNMPPEEEKRCSKMSYLSGRNRGMAAWRAKTKGRLGRKASMASVGIREQCTGITATCSCSGCRKFREGSPRPEQSQFRVYRAWGIGPV
jgi:hypothetical protein